MSVCSIHILVKILPDEGEVGGKKRFYCSKIFSQPKKIICNEGFMKQVLRLSEED